MARMFLVLWAVTLSGLLYAAPEESGILPAGARVLQERSDAQGTRVKLMLRKGRYLMESREQGVLKMRMKEVQRLQVKKDLLGGTTHTLVRFLLTNTELAGTSGYFLVEKKPILEGKAREVTWYNLDLDVGTFRGNAVLRGKSEDGVMFSYRQYCRK